MSKPWIGIPTGYENDQRRYGQDRRYIDAIESFGGLALLIPVLAGEELVSEYVDRINGILLPGSSTDVDPAHYGCEPHDRIGRIFAEREGLDFTLLEMAERRQLPVLGICFGAQSLNVFRGGSLFQDIPSEIPDASAHDREGRPQEAKAHRVRVAPGSRLQEVLNVNEIHVNSYHHQSVREPGRDLRVVGTAPDGVIEAIEDTGDRFVMGVQWHPETGWSNDGFSQALFAALMESAIINASS